jgi:hypothetical protein
MKVKTKNGKDVIPECIHTYSIGSKNSSIIGRIESTGNVHSWDLPSGNILGGFDQELGLVVNDLLKDICKDLLNYRYHLARDGSGHKYVFDGQSKGYNF